MITRRAALLQSSPPLRVFLGVLLIEALVSTGTLIWNVVTICRERNEGSGLISH